MAHNMNDMTGLKRKINPLHAALGAGVVTLMILAAAGAQAQLPSPTESSAQITNSQAPRIAGEAAANITPASVPDLSTPGLQMAVDSAAPENEEARRLRAEQLLIGLDATYQTKARLETRENIRPQDIGSLVYTMWEHMLIEEWRNTTAIQTRAPDGGERAVQSNSLRELFLSGIVWRARNDWTIWLNGQRMKPDALPREVMDITVHKQHIDLKWYDATTNLIYPVRLRPHQRFNIDSRMFLPGTGEAVQ